MLFVAGWALLRKHYRVTLGIIALGALGVGMSWTGVAAQAADAPSATRDGVCVTDVPTPAETTSPIPAQTPSETPKPEQPKPQDPKPEQPKPEQPKPQDPKPETPKPEHPKPEHPKPEHPKPEHPKPQDPKPEQPKPQDPKPEQPKPEQPKPEQPKPQDPKPAESTLYNPVGINKSSVTAENIKAVFTRINEIRVENGLQPLRPDQVRVGINEWADLSERHLQDQVQFNRDQENNDLLDTHDGHIVGNEVAAKGSTSADFNVDFTTFVGSWWNSKSHREILFQPTEDQFYGGPNVEGSYLVINMSQYDKTGDWEESWDARAAWVKDTSSHFKSTVPITDVDTSLRDYKMPTVPADAKYDPNLNRDYDQSFTTDKADMERYMNGEQHIATPKPKVNQGPPPAAEPAPATEPAAEAESPEAAETPAPAEDVAAGDATAEATEAPAADEAAESPEDDSNAAESIDDFIAGNPADEAIEPAPAQ